MSYFYLMIVHVKQDDNTLYSNGENHNTNRNNLNNSFYIYKPGFTAITWL